jgi:hypothetical protein
MMPLDFFGRRPAGLFITHVVNERLVKHYERLKQQSERLIDWRFVHNRWNMFDIAAGRTPLSVKLPAPRLEEALRHGRLQVGYLDLFVVPLALMTKRNQVWVIEYDVDYAGNWETFFKQFRGNKIDLLTTTINTHDLDPNWTFWRTAITPRGVSPSMRTRAFLPLFRASRRFLNAYLQAVSGGEWGGHYEFLFPTIARALNLSIEDIGGNGRFTSNDRRGRNYLNTPHDAHLSPGTFVWRPSCTAYFHENAGQFDLRDMLYHPVKPAVPEWND